MSTQQNEYTMLVVQNQEKILLDYLRKSIDLEARLTILSNQFEQLKKTNEEMTIQFENSNEIIKQATVSIENLSNKNIDFQNEINSLYKVISEKDKNYNELIDTKNLHESKHYEYRRECDRLQNELNKAYDEKNIVVNTTPKKKIIKKTEDDF